MASCLGHPEHGYYDARSRSAPAGDFTTAPEISQMFGELIGLALAQAWLDQGAPGPVDAGRTRTWPRHLMADILRATRRRARAFTRRKRCTWSRQARAARRARRAGWPITRPHGSTAPTLPEAPLFLVANEFFDALPVRQFVRDGDGLARARGRPADGRWLSASQGPSRNLRSATGCRTRATAIWWKPVRLQRPLPRDIGARLAGMAGRR